MTNVIVFHKSHDYICKKNNVMILSIVLKNQEITFFDNFEKLVSNKQMLSKTDVIVLMYVINGKLIIEKDYANVYFNLEN